MDQKIKAALIVILVALAIVGIVYAIIIVSNSLTITPLTPPSLTLTVSTQTPTVGNPITLTATLGSGASGVTVTFLKDGVSIGTANTVAGVANLNYVIPDATPWTASASCVV